MTLNEYLDDAQISDQAFADKIGVTQSYISRLRRGLVNPSLQLGLRIKQVTKGKVALESLLPRKLEGGHRQAV